MDTAHLNDLPRIAGLGTTAPWSAAQGISPAAMAAYKARARVLRAQATRAFFAGLAHGVARRLRRLSRAVPSGALGPGALDMDCAHGRPC